MLKIKNMKVEGFKVAEVPITFYKNTGLEKAIDHLYLEVDRAYRDGANILILTDRGVDEIRMPIPSLLAVSAVHQYLVRTKQPYLSGSDSGVRRTKRGSSLCDTARIWRECRESISGIGYDPSAD